jgi:hypothetical protein
MAERLIAGLKQHDLRHLTQVEWQARKRASVRGYKRVGLWVTVDLRPTTREGDWVRLVNQVRDMLIFLGVRHFVVSEADPGLVEYQWNLVAPGHLLLRLEA